MKNILLSFVMLFLVQAVFGQNEHLMTNATVRECNGVFKSSGVGKTVGHYGHDEDLIFTVCVPGSQSIDWDFKSFCTEKDFDFLKIYRGKDTFGNLLGTYSGVQGPNKFSVSDSCITFYFHSDKSVSCTGWEAMWSSKIVFMPNPVLKPIPNPNCLDTEIEIEFDQFFPCDSISAANFSLSGPMNASPVSVTPIGCSIDTFTNKFKIQFSPPFNMSGDYTLDFVVKVKDLCDSVWTLQGSQDFKINNCPITVKLESDDSTLCFGHCVQIRSTIEGGNPNNYVYNWISGGLSGAGPHTVCPSTTSTYILEVTDGVSVPGRDTIVITVLDPPVAQNDTVVCQSSPTFRLQSETAGGTWVGPGIVNVNGDFSPANSGPGLIKVWYKVGLCADTVIVNVRPISAGAAQASCPHAASFQMTGFTPIGGFWTGPELDSSGLFTPDSIGQFRVTYNWGGCQASKWVYVDSLNVPETDTSCLSDAQFFLTFSPPGGRWSGPGITHTVLGRFNPATALAGDKTLVYTLNGCRDTTFMHVVNINAGAPIVVCPTGGEVNLPTPTPLGGIWTGAGIVDSVTGIFNPDYLNNNQVDSLYYTASGCVDKLFVNAIQTSIQQDSVSVCPRNAFVNLLPPSIQRVPTTGIWSGTSVSGNVFFPPIAGSSKHVLNYSANQCTDSLVVQVLPEFEIQQDTTLCFGDYEVPLYASDSSGIWIGQGITSASLGTFNPKMAGVGIKTIQFISSSGCRDTLRINITPLPIIQLTTTPNIFCVKDSLFPLTALPDTGFFFGNGVANRTFNPFLLDTNFSKIYYQVGAGNCIVIDSFSVGLRPKLEVTINSLKDSLCQFASSSLIANVTGGDSFSYKYRWSEGQTGVNSIFIFPDQTRQYYVEVTDGCSNPASDTLEVFVNSLPQFLVETNPPLCYGEMGFAKAVGLNSTSLRFEWGTLPKQIGDSISASIGANYPLTIIDTLTGCSKDTIVSLPSYERVIARFLVQTDGECISPINEFLPISNLSENALSGQWIISNNPSIAFDPLQDPKVLLDHSNQSIRILLFVESKEGCIDSFEQEYCIKDTVFLYVPTAFSPNNDKRNDDFSVSVTNVRKFSVQIFNRWGEKVFESDDPDFRWDGTSEGKDCPSGFYVYKIRYFSWGTQAGGETGTVYLLR